MRVVDESRLTGSKARTKSINPEYAEASIESTLFISGQHVPGTVGFHNFSTGLHWNKKEKAAITSRRFVDTMIAHMTILILPLSMFKSVTANDVLLQAMAKGTRNPTMSSLIPIRVNASTPCSAMISISCFPKPSRTSRVIRALVDRRMHYQKISQKPKVHRTCSLPRTRPRYSHPRMATLVCKTYKTAVAKGIGKREACKSKARQ